MAPGGSGVERVRTEPLAAAAFAPFGQVVAAGDGPGAATNRGTAVRWDWLAALESTRPAARANLAVFRAAPQALPLALRLLERHPCSSQAFLPLACARYLLCVAPAAEDGRPRLAGLRAFLCGPGQGLNLGRGVWHHPVVALDAPAELAVLTWQDGTAGDTVEHALTAALEIVDGGPAAR